MDASVYSEAKGEYTKQLTLFIVPVFHRFFMELLQQATTEEPQEKRQLWKFQELLSQIPEWNMDKVQREVQKIIQQIHCDYLEDLLTAVFIAHTKVLTAIRVGNKNKRVQITIPKLEHFMHRALTESSRLLWSSAYLFHNEMSALEKQKNHRQIEQLLHEGIAQAIRGLLPVKNILKDYLTEPEHEDTDVDDEADEDEKEEKEAEVKEAEIKEAEIKEAEVKESEIKEAEIKEAEIKEAEIKEAEIKEESNILIEQGEPPVPTIPVSLFSPSIAVDESASLVLKEEHASTSAPETTIKEEPSILPVIKLDAPEPPTLVVETEPSVGFTNFDQVIQKRGDKTHIDYVEQNRDRAESDENEKDFIFASDETEPLSDYEDLEEGQTEALDADDFETLP